MKGWEGKIEVRVIGLEGVLCLQCKARLRGARIYSCNIVSWWACLHSNPLARRKLRLHQNPHGIGAKYFFASRLVTDV